MTKKRGKRHQPDQIVKILAESEQGKTVEQICRDHGISTATYYNLRSMYDSMDGRP